MDKCPMFLVAQALDGRCPDVVRCVRRCRFRDLKVIQVSLAGFKVPPTVRRWPRAWKRELSRRFCTRRAPRQHPER